MVGWGFVVAVVVVGADASSAVTGGSAPSLGTAPGVDEFPPTSANGTPTKIRMPAATRPTSAPPCKRDAMPLLSLSQGVASAGKSATAGTSRSHWGHRDPDIVWSHVQRASDVYWEPHRVVVGLGELSATACHSGAQ